jgi:hypothetical protein
MIWLPQKRARFKWPVARYGEVIRSALVLGRLTGLSAGVAADGLSDRECALF